MKTDRIRRRRITGIITIFSLIALAGMISCSPARNNLSLMTAAEVVWLEGEVSVDGKVVSIGDEISNGAEIVTGPDSLVELTFGDYRILRAGENSRLFLDVVDRKMTLDAGAISVMQSKSRRFGKNKAWELHTPITVAAVRGTVYYAQVQNPNETYFCLCNGKIHLEDTDGESPRDLEAIHHSAVTIKRSGTGVDYQIGTMLYHNDEDQESLADRVHVPIDWTKVSE